MTEKEINEKIQKLKKSGHDGVYDYYVYGIDDNESGTIDSQALADILLKFSLDGWRLKFVFTNEILRNTTSGGFGGFSVGQNRTMERTFFIFERYLKI